MLRRNILVIGILTGSTALACALAVLWLDPDGHLRNTRWQAPQPVTIDMASMVTGMPESKAWQDGRLLLQLQERPLFILSRRPLPSPLAPVEEKAPEPDIWSQAQLLGIFEGSKSGAILMVQGKEQRLMLNQSLGGWTLSKILSRQIELGKGGVTRNLVLYRAPLDKGPDSNPPAAAWRPTAPLSMMAEPSPASTPASASGAMPAPTPAPTPAPGKAPAGAKPPAAAETQGAVFGGTKTGK